MVAGVSRRGSGYQGRAWRLPDPHSSGSFAPLQCCRARALRLVARGVCRQSPLGSAWAMLLILALLLVLVLFGAGFALHVLWIAAVVFAVVWIVGFALGRGEGAGRHHFDRW